MMSVPKCIGTTLLLCIPLFAQEQSLTRAQFDEQMTSLQKKEQQLREQIASEQTSIIELKERLDATRNRIRTVRKSKLSLVGLTENGLADFTSRAKQVQRELTRLMSIEDSDFLADSASFQSLKTNAETIVHHRGARLRSLRPVIDTILQNIAAAQIRYQSLTTQENQNEVAEETVESEEPSFREQTTYTVENRDGVPETLYGIAEKVYGDPQRWVRIYEANKPVIDRNFNKIKGNTALKTIAEPSDLIFPGQVLTIPR